MAGQILFGILSVPEHDPVRTERPVPGAVIENAVLYRSRKDRSVRGKIADVRERSGRRIVQKELPVRALQKQRGREKIHVGGERIRIGELLPRPADRVHFHGGRSGAGIELRRIIAELDGEIRTGHGKRLQTFFHRRIPFSFKAEADLPVELRVGRRKDILPCDRAVGKNLIGQQSVSAGVIAQRGAGHPSEPAERTAFGDSLRKAVHGFPGGSKKIFRLPGKFLHPFSRKNPPLQLGGALLQTGKVRSGGKEGPKFSDGIQEFDVAVCVVHPSIGAVEERVIFTDLRCAEVGGKSRAKGGNLPFQIREGDRIPPQIAQIVQKAVQIPDQHIRSIGVSEQDLLPDLLFCRFQEREVPSDRSGLDGQLQRIGTLLQLQCNETSALPTTDLHEIGGDFSVAGQLPEPVRIAFQQIESLPGNRTGCAQRHDLFSGTPCKETGEVDLLSRTEADRASVGRFPHLRKCQSLKLFGTLIRSGIQIIRLEIRKFSGHAIVAEPGIRRAEDIFEFRTAQSFFPDQLSLPRPDRPNGSIPLQDQFQNILFPIVPGSVFLHGRLKRNRGFSDVIELKAPFSVPALLQICAQVRLIRRQRLFPFKCATLNQQSRFLIHPFSRFKHLVRMRHRSEASAYRHRVPGGEIAEKHLRILRVDIPVFRTPLIHTGKKIGPADHFAGNPAVHPSLQSGREIPRVLEPLLDNRSGQHSASCGKQQKQSCQFF